MDKDLGFMQIKEEHMLLLQLILVMVFIPLSNWVIYPILKFVGIERPLQKMAAGGIFLGLAFVCAGILEIDLNRKELDSSSLDAQHNGTLCVYTVRANRSDPQEINQKFVYEILTKDTNCPELDERHVTDSLKTSEQILRLILLPEILNETKNILDLPSINNVINTTDQTKNSKHEHTLAINLTEIPKIQGKSTTHILYQLPQHILMALSEVIGQKIH
jgi:hypothetical protein